MAIEVGELQRVAFAQMERVAFAVNAPFLGLIADEQGFLQYEEAKAKSKVLLKEWLSPDQLADYTFNGYFWVEGQITKHKYRINECNSFNVTRYIDDKPHSRLCFYPDGSYGLTGDVMLAQKLALENYEEIALNRANQGPA